MSPSPSPSRAYQAPLLTTTTLTCPHLAITHPIATPLTATHALSLCLSQLHMQCHHTPSSHTRPVTAHPSCVCHIATPLLAAPALSLPLLQLHAPHCHAPYGCIHHTQHDSNNHNTIHSTMMAPLTPYVAQRLRLRHHTQLKGHNCNTHTAQGL